MLEKIFRFSIIGVLNTLITICIYFYLSQFVENEIAYTFSYLFGIAFSIIFASRFVFSFALSPRIIFLQIVIYLIAFGFGRMILSLVDLLELKQVFEVFAIIASASVSFLGSLALRRFIDV